MIESDIFEFTDEQRERLRALHSKMIDRFLEEANPDNAPKAQGDRYYHRRASTELARNIAALQDLCASDMETKIAQMESKLKKPKGT